MDPRRNIERRKRRRARLELGRKVLLQMKTFTLQVGSRNSRNRILRHGGRRLRVLARVEAEQ